MTKDAAELEALLFAAGEPLSKERIAELMDTGIIEVSDILRQLEKELTGHGIMIREVSGGWQLSTRPKYYSVLEKLSETISQKLSTAMMETLAIIAYMQPVTKIEIENIRGVKADRAINKLIGFELIEEVGRKPVIGRPILYGTTDNFLHCTGIRSLKELPSLPENIS